MVTSLTTTLHA